jgi:hypothetical protein
MSSSWVSKTLGLIGGADDEEGGDDENLMVLVQGKNSFNDLIYCYIKIAGHHLEDFKATLESASSFDLRQFGTVVAAGRGRPTRDVQTEVIQEFAIKPIQNSD